MTQEIKEAIKTRNLLRKSAALNKEEWIEACKTTSEMIRQKKQEMWRSYVNEISSTTDSKQVWRMIRGMDGRRPPPKKKKKEKKSMIVLCNAGIKGELTCREIPYSHFYAGYNLTPALIPPIANFRITSLRAVNNAKN